MSPSPRSRRLLAWGLKLLVLVASVTLLVRVVDWGEFVAALGETPPWAFVAAVALNLVSAVIMAWRWHLLVLAAGVRLAFRETVAYTFLGMFFNQVLPGSVSGDAARIWCLGRRQAGWGRSAGVVLWDRVLGLVALVLILLATLPVYGELLMARRAVWLTWAFFAGVFAAFVGLRQRRFLDLVGGLLARLAARFRGAEGERRVDRLLEGLRGFLSDGGLLARGLLLSLAVRLVWLLGAVALSAALRLPVPPAYWLLAISLVELVRSLPVSIQGLGVRELALVGLLAPLGVSSARATLISLLFYTALTVAGLLAGLAWAAGLKVRDDAGT